MKNIIFKNYIFDTSIELKPSIRISPFNEEYLNCPINNPLDGECYLKNRFCNYRLTIKGRSAIELALSYYQLKKDDTVTILTSSNNFYISSCVTNTIEKYCSWSRKISDKTKVIFVNHEFGYPYPNLQSLKEYNIPIIEDCAHCFMSDDELGLVGKTGDFAIYSLPKFFPMQMGGILSINNNSIHIPDTIEENHKDYILRNISCNLSTLENICERRLTNYHYLKEQLKTIGIQPYFEEKRRTIPNVFLFKWHSNINYALLKEFMQSNGVECSVFYGQNAFFVPVHQNLKKSHLDYIISLLKYYYNDLF